jgi:hypothetical protein
VKVVVDGFHILMRQTKEKLLVEGRERRPGGHVSNVSKKHIWNCHNESLTLIQPFTEYIHPIKRIL